VRGLPRIFLDRGELEQIFGAEGADDSSQAAPPYREDVRYGRPDSPHPYRGVSANAASSRTCSTRELLDLRICPACGDRADRPWVEGTHLSCARCGHRWPFRRLPLFALTGPSGAGKSTVGPLLWIDGLRDDVDGHPAFRSV
jgi:hypothetical protein